VTHTDHNNVITAIDYITDRGTINFLYRIRRKSKFLSTNHKDKFTNFDRSIQFYLVSTVNGKFVLPINNISPNKYNKIRF